MINFRVAARHFITVLGILGLQPRVFPVEGIVTNLENRSFEGDMKAHGDGSLTVDAAAGDGSVSYTFKSENLANIAFLDSEAVEDGMDAYEQMKYGTAIEFLAVIHRNRSPFFKLFPSAPLVEPSLALGNAYLKEEQFANATGVAGVLLGSGFSDPELEAKANEILLLAFFGLRRWDETEVLARNWCKSHEPFNESALGWWILGEVHLKRGDLEKARWVSLQPITFSSQFPKAYLQDCYHVAIASWIEESPDSALRLYDEYQNRGYTWPEDKHPETRIQLGTLATTTQETSNNDENEKPLTIEEGAPKKDLNLPLKSVRKLTTDK